MLANINKTKLALAVVAAATAFTAPVVSAAEKSDLTVVPNFYPTMVRNFNPYLSTNLHTTSDFVYEPLVVFNQMKGNEPVMRLAKDYYMSDDLMQVTFEIRDGVKWSDGKAFSADDVVYSFDQINVVSTSGLNQLSKTVTKLSSI